MKPLHLEPNPYAAPLYSGEARPPDWYLASGCRCFKGIGYGMIIWLSCLIPLWLFALVADNSPPRVDMLFPPAFFAGGLIFFSEMIRMANRLPKDFERSYPRARWLGILAGSLGFPILTVPAFLGVSRLRMYQTLIRHDSDASR